MFRTINIIIILLFSSILIAGPEDWRIALCISEDPQHEMNVSWRTVIELDAPRVELALNTPLAKFYKDRHSFNVDPESVVLSDGSEVFAYSSIMDNLEPGTSYAYRVGSQEEWSEWFVFETARRNDAPFRFLYFGDPQNGLLSHVSRAIRAGYGEAPDAAFITMAGDLVSVPGIDQQWEYLFHAGSWIFGQIPLVPVMGNHAYYIDGKWLDQHSPYWRPHFTLPENGLSTLAETNYYFHYQGLLFVVLNGSEQLKEQAIWLDEILSREESTWVILSMHQPLYSTGQGRDGARRRAAFLSVIDKHEVDLVLQGHDHTFGRTYPLKAGVAVKHREKGTIYINSVSGSKQYNLEPAIEGVFAITDANKQFYHVIDVHPSKLKLSSYTVDGELKDEVIIKPSQTR
ncbi:MAG: metallophosphoesterase family protein [FCB group bacterium]|nr:metallophosphoesterase family protein [FCB group bacterium]MBL7029184.1 metallophosphoesterase family protein [Candidatus Neomarinimicrobiota bacterium]MBL7120488.1 metallophosphoesterase family protein [Candidatus Neomarinimicrobiota bacterium]